MDTNEHEFRGAEGSFQGLVASPFGIPKRVRIELGFIRVDSCSFVVQRIIPAEMMLRLVEKKLCCAAVAGGANKMSAKTLCQSGVRP
jgi:hypothetical protein